jgi:hypothetical protein
MEKMGRIVNKNQKKLKTIVLFLVLPLLMNGQFSKNKLSGAFSYLGNSKNRLTENSSSQLLIKDLTTGAYLSSQNMSCHSDIGLYLFKVNSNGKIQGKDIIYYGTLVDSTQQSILNNIKKTSGKYLKPTRNTHQKEHWYLFEYLSNGYKYGCFDRNCRNEQSMLEDQLVNYKIMIWATFEKVKNVRNVLTFIDGNSNDEAFRKGLIKREERKEM